MHAKAFMMANLLETMHAFCCSGLQLFACNLLLTRYHGSSLIGALHTWLARKCPMGLFTFMRCKVFSHITSMCHCLCLCSHFRLNAFIKRVCKRVCLLIVDSCLRPRGLELVWRVCYRGEPCVNQLQLASGNGRENSNSGGGSSRNKLIWLIYIYIILTLARRRWVESVSRRPSLFGGKLMLLLAQQFTV